MSEVIKPFEIFRVSVPDGEYSRRADVVEKLHYDAAQSQLAALREELAEWKARAGRRTNDMGEISSEKLELKQRLADAERLNAELRKELAEQQAIKEQPGENTLWEVLDAAVGIITRRAYPHALESEAHQAGVKVILARRAGLTATHLKPTESGASE